LAEPSAPVDERITRPGLGIEAMQDHFVAVGLHILGPMVLANVVRSASGCRGQSNGFVAPVSERQRQEVLAIADCGFLYKQKQA